MGWAPDLLAGGERLASPSVLFEADLPAEGGPAARVLNDRIAFLDLEFFDWLVSNSLEEYGEQN